MKKHVAITLALGILFAAALALAAQTKPADLKFEGTIVSVDSKAHTFLVKGMDKAKPVEMTFHAGEESKILVDGERVLLTSLEKGEHVTVDYQTENAKHLVKHVHRHKAT